VVGSQRIFLAGLILVLHRRVAHATRSDPFFH